MEIHDHMPLCLAPAQFDTWLDHALQDPERLLALIGTTVSPQLKVYPVSPRLINPNYDHPDAIGPMT